MIARLQWEDWERLSRIGNVAASFDDRRPILAGINFEADEGRLRAVATDSYKLATVVVDAEIDEGGPILLPARQVKIATSALRQLARAQFDPKFAKTHDAEIDLVDPPGEDPEVILELNVGDRYVGSLTIDQILPEGNHVGFPKWRPLLRKPGEELAPSTLARKTREEVLEYVNLRYGKAWSDDSKKKDLLAYDAAKREHPQPRSIGLNQDHLNGLMKTTTTRYPEYLRIEMFGEARPVFFSNPTDKDWQGIQMPVRT